MHPADNVAIVANDGGLPAGTVLPSGLTLLDKVPQAHKVALVDIPEGGEVRRYNVIIGYALKPIAAGSWVHERLLQMPEARSLEGLPIATVKPPVLEPLAGYTFEGYRNADGTVGTRNILAITTTVQCVAGVLDFAVRRIKSELLPRYPHVDDVVGLEHSYGCGVAIDAVGAEIPQRTLRNISRNPNFGGEVMVVSLGCEKLQPERLLPPGSFPIVDEREPALDVVCLQDEAHVGFMSMIDSIMRQAEQHLRRLDARRRETVPAPWWWVRAAAATPSAASPPTRPWALHRPAGARGRHRDVQRGDRGARRHRPAHLARRKPRSGRSHDRGNGLVRRLSGQGPRGPQRQHHAGQQKGGLSNIVEKAMGSIVKSGTAPSPACCRRVSGWPIATSARSGLCGHAGQRLHLRHAAAGGRHEPACLHHGPRHAYGLAQVPVIKVATRSDLRGAGTI
jgi:galactarate dehydratase